MKTIRPLIWLFVLATLGCNQQQDRPHHPIDHPDHSHETDCVKPAYALFPQTVAMWEQSWLWAHNKDVWDESIQFTNTNMDLLMGLCQTGDCEGVRMYYILETPEDSIPGLAVVNVSGCDDFFDPAAKDILVSGIGGTVEQFLSANEVCIMTQNWRTHQRAKAPVRTPVHAYNYSWQQLQNMLDYGAQEILIRYGLRTISPADTMFAKATQEVPIAGSIVYANILYSDLEKQPFLDFTFPCPQKCGMANQLNDSCE